MAEDKPLPPKVLPVELYRLIVENLQDDIPTLLSLTVASSILGAEATRCLYRDVAITELHDPVTVEWQDLNGNRNKFVFEFQDLHRSTKFLHIREETAKHIRRFSLVHKHWSNTRNNLNGYHALLKRLLRAAVNLKCLEIHYFTSHPPAAMLRDCAFRLVEFSWGPVHDVLAMWAFLGRQPLLKRLDLRIQSYAVVPTIAPEFCPPLPPSACLNLRELTIYGSYVSAFASHWPTQSLIWHDVTERDVIAVRDVIAAPLRNILSLSLVHLRDDKALCLLEPYLSNLQFLSVNRKKSMLKDKHEALTSLQGLQLIAARYHADRYSARRTVENLFLAIPSLQFVELGTRHDEPVRRWDRGIKEARQLPLPSKSATVLAERHL